MTANLLDDGVVDTLGSVGAAACAVAQLREKLVDKRVSRMTTAIDLSTNGPATAGELQNGIEHAVTPRSAADRHQGMMTFAHRVGASSSHGDCSERTGMGERAPRRDIVDTLTVARQ